jgi:ribosome production factor 2
MAPTSSSSIASGRGGGGAAGKASLAAKAVGKKKTKARVQRYLKSTEPQAKEGPKAKLLLKGTKCSQLVYDALRDVRALTSPHAKLLANKNPLVPLETDGQRSLEFLCQKNDAALFAVGSNSKKRPNYITLGRTFDRQILDIAELALLRFKSMKEYGGSVPKKRIGSKPLMLFVGDAWHDHADYRNLQNLLVDFYRGDVVDKLIATGLDHILVFTAANEASNDGSGTAGGGRILVHQRAYFCKLKKSSDASSNAPVPLLVPCGPDLDLSLRRTQWANRDLYSASRKQPGSLRAKKRKNQATNALGETLGRLHVPKQNVDKMRGKKSKALRRAERAEAQEEEGAIKRELDAEREDMERQEERDAR